MVNTRVTLLTGSTYNVIFQLSRAGNEYRILDVSVLGFSLSYLQRGIFQRYIATSPAVENEAVRLLDLSSLPPAGTSVPARLFTCVGSDDVEYRAGIEQLQAELVGRHYQDLRYEHVSYPGMHHIATGASGFIAGLQSVFTA